MSESKEELEESIKFYKDGLIELENDLSFHVMSAYHTQEKINNYKDDLQKLLGDLGEVNDGPK